MAVVGCFSTSAELGFTSQGSEPVASKKGRRADSLSRRKDTESQEAKPITTDTAEWQKLDPEPSDCEKWLALRIKKEGDKIFWLVLAKLAVEDTKRMLVVTKEGEQWTMTDADGKQVVTVGKGPKDDNAMKAYLLSRLPTGF